MRETHEVKYTQEFRKIKKQQGRHTVYVYWIKK